MIQGSSGDKKPGDGMRYTSLAAMPDDAAVVLRLLGASLSKLARRMLLREAVRRDGAMMEVSLACIKAEWLCSLLGNKTTQVISMGPESNRWRIISAPILQSGPFIRLIVLQKRDTKLCFAYL
jgi:hypothetical protein